MSPAANTLATATSPYLRQHADNPVHWQQWTPEALDEAARRDVPILLSIGYAACHWCHVMAHESFEDDQVAAACNADFVCIKVDREERPDLDAVYMNATVAMTGQGGWPMTCFLTPDGRPFFCGTYYPKPQFLQLLAAVAETWRVQRDEVEQASDQVAGELRRMASGLPGGGPEIDPRLCDHAAAVILRDEDTERGGFGRAPKFPPSALLEALLRTYERTRSPAPLAAVARTGAAMARGGIYDQLAGGFARYSVDDDWVVPHFEKMLYDNALLLRAYAHWARRTDDPLARRVAAQTAAFLINDLADGDMFTSSLDADAAGSEGSTYVWTPAQLSEVLGEDDGRWAATVFEVTERGTFEHGASVLQLLEDVDDPLHRQAPLVSPNKYVQILHPVVSPIENHFEQQIAIQEQLANSAEIFNRELAPDAGTGEMLKTFEAAEQGPIPAIPVRQCLNAEIDATLLALDPLVSFGFPQTFFVKAERLHC